MEDEIETFSKKIKFITRDKYKKEKELLIEVKYTKEEDSTTFKLFDLTKEVKIDINSHKSNNKNYLENIKKQNSNKIGTITYFTNPLDSYYDDYEFYKNEFIKEKDNYEKDINYNQFDINISQDELNRINVYDLKELQEFQKFQEMEEIMLNYEKVFHHSIELLEIENDYRKLGLGKLLINLAMQDIKDNYIDDIITLNASPMDYGKDMEIDKLVKFYNESGFQTFFNQYKNQQMVIFDEDDINISKNNEKYLNKIFGLMEDDSKEINEFLSNNFLTSIDELETYEVGGCVRDELMGKEPKDIDYTVKSTNKNMHLQMLKLGFKQVGADFPVYLHPETNDEYALMRTERLKKNDNDEKINAYHNFDIETENVTLEEDLGRRDLTINAIAKDKDGNYIDPFNGKDDIKNKIIRHIKDDGFEEDPLRILRVARFAARYSDFKIAPETIKLMKKMVKRGDIDNLQPERIFLEIEKVLKDNNKPSIFFKILDKINALEIILPELYLLKGKEQNPKHHTEGDGFEHSLLVLDTASKETNNPLLRFAALFHDIGKGFTNKELAKELKYHSHDNIDLPIIELNEIEKKLLKINNIEEKDSIKLIDIIDNMQNKLRIPNEYIKLLKKSIELHHLIHNFDILSPKRIIKLFQDFRHKKDKDFLYEILEVSKYDNQGRLFLIDNKDFKDDLYEIISNDNDIQDLKKQNRLLNYSEVVKDNQIIVKSTNKEYLLKIDKIKKYYDFFLSLNVKTMNIDVEKFKGKNGDYISNIINQSTIKHFKEYLHENEKKINIDNNESSTSNKIELITKGKNDIKFP